MNLIPTRYQFLRDRRDWQGSLLGLEPDADGNLLLAALPGPADGVAVVLAPPFDIGASGIAAGPCKSVFIADTAGNRVIYQDGLCAASAVLHHLSAPRGLAINADALWVADCGHHRARSFAFPALEANLDLPASQPTGMGCDAAGGVYVLDRDTQTVRRFDGGNPDAAYNAKLAASGKLTAPLFLAVAPDGRLIVSDGTTGAVRSFDATGSFLQDLPVPPGGWQPGALAFGGGRIFVADRASGLIHVYRDDATWWCVLPNFAGPVTALAADPQSGDLLIKTALDDSYLRFTADGAYGAEGSITAGPFDAGERQEWFRAAANADLPAGCSLRFEIAQAESAVFPPGGWVVAPAPDTLLATVLPAGPPPDLRRFLWLRVHLTGNTTATPTLRAIRAETAGEDYRDYLPEIYAIEDDPNLFLYRLLALARTELGAVDEHIDAIPQLLSPQFIPNSQLPWLAGWLGLALPLIATDAESRALIADAIRLWRRRGTPGGICDMVEIYTGLRPSITELFEARGLWVLDESSRLGFDTGLPFIDPLGMVVPDSVDPLSLGADCCATPVGNAVVGASGPLAIEDLGEPLFTDAAHRFVVFLPAYRATDAGLVAEARRIIEAEKPAYTGYDLCLIRPDMRVGFQAVVGVDTIVGGPEPPLRLGDALLNATASLPPPLGGATRLGQNTTLGGETMTLR